MREWVWQVALVTIVAAITMFTNLGGPRLWDRDEPRNAGCAREMLIRGDWVTPAFNDELRTHKPVLLYWLIMSAYSAFGVNEFSARFWSAALAIGTSLCTYVIGRRLFNGQVGMWAGIILATSLMFGVAGRAATPDSVLIFFSTLAITLYVVGTFPVGETGPMKAGTYVPARWSSVAAVYAAMGMAILAKGPVGLVLPTAVIGMFLLIMRLPADEGVARPGWWRVIRSVRVFAPLHFLKTCWSMRPLTAIGVALAIALPWYVWVGIRTDGEFLRGFFLEHNFGRAIQSLEGHGGSVLFYPGAMLVGFFPWSVFAVPLIIDFVARLRRDDNQRVGYILLASWVGVYVGLFSLARTKLPSYVTPCYPALALATGCFLHHWLHDRVVGWLLWRRLAWAAFILVGVVLLVALPLVAGRYLPGEEWLGAIGLVPLVGGIVGWVLMERNQLTASTGAFAVTSLLFIAALLGLATLRIDRHQQNHRLLSAIAEQGEAVRVASLGLLEPTWIFYGDRPVNELAWNGEAQWSGTYAEIDGRWQRKTPIGLIDLAAEDESWVLITTDEHFERLREKIPRGFEVLAEAPYFLKKDRLILVGRPVDERSTRVAERDARTQ